MTIKYFVKLPFNNDKEKLEYYETRLRQLISKDSRCISEDGNCPDTMEDCSACLALHILQNAPT